MPELEDLGDLLSPTLDLPVAGKVYRVPSPPALVGLRLQASWAVTHARRAGATPKSRYLQLLTDDDGATTLEQDALGPVHDEMLADGVSVDVLNHAGFTAYLWVVAGEQAARAYWAAPLGKALTRPLPSTSTSTGAASTTRSRASSSGTRSRRSSKRGSKPPANG
ncbi:DUF7426 family protein [Cellulosimicrobium sp. JZ28]|uniref:DUF7426 family protein n=1 Tax=Cellulosimicrobium sp. JZ28 TaxID=1906273 RepID=UPI00188AC803|nr:hypothetical protein [Cellulosimicrobium sp. JZ28]